MDTPKKKTSNVSSDQIRALNGIKLHSKNYVEKASQSILVLKLNSGRKIDISGDKQSVKEIGKYMELVNQFESLLLASYAKGVTEFSSLQEELVTDKNVASDAETLYKCKLPRTKFRIFSEKKQFLTNVRSSLGAVMEAEGYGRGKKNAGEGKGKLSYKTGTPPAWWNETCESIVPWNVFGGVNKPKEWQGTWSFAMYDLLVIAYTFYLKEKDLVDSYTLPTEPQQHGECSHVHPGPSLPEEYQITSSSMHQPSGTYQAQDPLPSIQSQSTSAFHPEGSLSNPSTLVSTGDLTTALSNEFLLDIDNPGEIVDLNNSNTDLEAMLSDLGNSNTLPKPTFRENPGFELENGLNDDLEHIVPPPPSIPHTPRRLREFPAEIIQPNTPGSLKRKDL